MAALDERRARARSGARTRPACSRTSGPAADCRSAGRSRRRARRRPRPRCSAPGVSSSSPGRPRRDVDRLGAARQDRDAVPGPLAATRPRRSRRRAIAARGNSASAALSSCRRRRRARPPSSHSSRSGRRRLTPLMLQVAIFRGDAAGEGRESARRRGSATPAPTSRERRGRAGASPAQRADPARLASARRRRRRLRIGAARRHLAPCRAAFCGHFGDALARRAAIRASSRRPR